MDFLREVEANTGETPPALRDAPLLEGETLEEYRVFLDVGKNRAYSPGGPLPISDGNLIDYLRANLIPEHEWAEIRDFVSRFDNIWLEEHFAHAEANKPTQKA